ncbi:MAG: isochorismatase family protein [Methanoregula sp.]
MKEALLIIDVQNEYFTGRLPMTHPAVSLENILMAMDRAHDGRMPVVFIQHTNAAPEATTFRKGTPAWEFHDEIKRRHADVVIEKTLPGSFTGTPLENWLRERSIATVTIAVSMTRICCDTTARRAFHRTYAVNFLADATGMLSITNNSRLHHCCRAPPCNPDHPAAEVLPRYDHQGMDYGILNCGSRECCNKIRSFQQFSQVSY